MEDKYKDFAILILSCDKYEDMWAPFGRAFKRYFPQMGLKVYLGTNIRNPKLDWAETILSGEDHDWSSSYRKILNQIPEKYLFVILEDLFIASEIERQKLTGIFDFALDNNPLLIRYWSSPRPNLPTKSEDIGMSIAGYPFTTTVCGLWDKNRLLKILIDGENPWMFEIMGSYRSQYYGDVYSTWEPICKYLNMIEKGRWIPQSLNSALEYGLLEKVSARPNRSGIDAVACYLKVGYYNVMFKYFSQSHRLKLMNFFRKILGCY